MTWFKGDDSLTNHPKFLLLRSHRGGKEAQGDWLHGGCWCAGQLTDGFLPEAARKALHISRKSAGLLVGVGLWEVVKGGHQFHNWLKYQPSKARVLAKRKGTAERVTKHRRNAATNAPPGPARPGPSEVPSEGTRSLTPDRFGAYEHMGAWFMDQGEARPSLVGKALDEFAARAAEVANVHECTLETAVYRLCAAAEAVQDGKPFVFRVRDCPVPKPDGNAERAAAEDAILARGRGSS